MFRTVLVPLPSKDPTSDIELEPVARGRAGAIVAWRDGDRVPLVRGTTRYTRATRMPPQALCDLARAVETAADVAIPFNNALVERYTGEYRNMRAHSDQAQDLQANSVIAVWSWYRNPHLPPSRAIRVRPKLTDQAETVVPLEHGHALIFDLAYNAAHLHRITGDTGTDDNEWTGVTLRASGTYLRNGMFSDGRALRLATAEEEAVFFACRKRENSRSDFEWPLFDFTVSPGDLIG